MTDKSQAVVKADSVAPAPASLYAQVFDGSDARGALKAARELVGAVHENCQGPMWIAKIQGRDYPQVNWWNAVGGVMGLVPRQHHVERLPRKSGAIVYEAEVGIYRGDQLVTIGSAICSQEEVRPSKKDWAEYAIRSMALTRATGKAYRTNLAFLACLAGLEATPAEEMPDFQGAPPQAPQGPQTVTPNVATKPHPLEKLITGNELRSDPPEAGQPSPFETWWGNLERAGSAAALKTAWESAPREWMTEAEISELSAFYQHRMKDFVAP